MSAARLCLFIPSSMTNSRPPQKRFGCKDVIEIVPLSVFLAKMNVIFNRQAKNIL